MNLDSTESYRQSNAFEITAEYKKAIDDYFRDPKRRIYERRDGKVFIHPKVYGSMDATELKGIGIQDKAIQVLSFLQRKFEFKESLPTLPIIKDYILNKCHFSYSERVRAVQASTASQAGPSSAPRPRLPQADSVPKNTFDVYSKMGSKAVQDLDLLSSVAEEIKILNPPPKRRRR